MIEHTPIGNPCDLCGKPATSHRIPHKFVVDPEVVGNCLKCHNHFDLHRTTRQRADVRKGRKRIPVEDERIDHAFVGDPLLVLHCEKCGLHHGLHRARERSYHIPIGNPCEKCGVIASRHRVEHKPNGEPCKKCGLVSKQHRVRKHLTESKKRCYIGIDGEGQGDEDHRYIMLAAARENGEEKWVVEAPPGGRLTTIQCLDMILKLPKKYAKIFSFAFNYDLTKILTDVDNASLYLLFRPDMRQRHGPDAYKGPYPVKWGEYSLNLQGTKFTVRKGWERRVIWDLFKFFQAKFVSALKDWKIGSEEMLKRMSSMKDKRGDDTWGKYDPESLLAIKNYCLEECQCIAELGHKLIAAHEKAELKLKTYYGAGSSGAAMLTAMGIKERMEPVPVMMKEAVACGFFGGRFENSVIGAINEPLYNYDISSAYPYHTTFLPCLQHGTWKKTDKREDIDGAAAALVRYGLGKNPGITTWGPFPFRGDDGSISFPIESGGGWVWKAEYVAGERLFSHVEFKEAWVYHTDCDCQPFEELPKYYLVRLKIGKEGAGIVIKLAVNSCYGKLAQSVGNALFNNWIWAGMITAGCRAQILDMLGLHKDWANLLMIATDGIYTREKLDCPAPRNTNTDEAIWDDKDKEFKRKPLGGWEEKFCPKGVFVARPGIYFPLHPTKEEIKAVRARGVGRGVVLEHWQKIVDAWEKNGVKGVARVPDVSRFCGAKTSIAKSSKGYTRAARDRHKKGGGTLPAYGQWIKRRVELSFDPKPKRERVNYDGLTLQLRKFPRNVTSMPYDSAMKSKDALEMIAATLEIMEQPDGDYMGDFDMAGGME